MWCSPPQPCVSVALCLSAATGPAAQARKRHESHLAREEEGHCMLWGPKHLCQSLLPSTRCQLSSLLLNANLHSYSARNDIFPMPVMQHGGSDTGGDGVGSAGQCREPPRWQSLCLPAAATQRRHSFACTSPLAPGFGIKAPCCREQLLGQAFSDCGFAPS